MANERPKYGKARSTIGSLFSTVTVTGSPAVLLPCVLDCWLNKFSYDDPLGGMDIPRNKPWHDSIRERMQVVIAKVDLDIAKESNYTVLNRIGYLGVYDISELEISDNHLRFTRAERRLIELVD